MPALLAITFRICVGCMLACACTAWADPLKSPQCGEAVAALEASRAASAPAAATEVLRRQAARTCLGSAQTPQRPSRVARPPTAVAPPAIMPPAPPAASLRAPAPLPPPVAIERAPQPAHCDTGGCWSNDGTQLRHVPPGAFGPRGPCTTQAGVVYCP